MDKNEKISLLEELLEVDEGTLTCDTVLKELEQWDSLAIISLIALFDEKFGKQMKGDQIRAFKTVCDILNEME